MKPFRNSRRLSLTSSYGHPVFLRLGKMSRVRVFDRYAFLMASTLEEGNNIARDFDDSACEFCDRYKSSGLSKSSAILLNFILEAGIQNRSILDLGCGAGGFSIEALKRGGESSVGIDLSPEMIKAANGLAVESGLGDRAKFQEGNAATSSLLPSDVVVLDKVMCCYSDVRPLLGNAALASRGLLGFVVPRDDGLMKWPLRVGVRIVNFFERRRRGIQFYLHPLDEIDRSLRDAGFARQRKRGSRFWLVLLYKRATRD